MHNSHNSAIVFPSQSESAKDRPGNLRAPGRLAQQPLVGWLLVLLGGLAFGVIAAGIQANPGLNPIDIQVSNAIHTAALQSSPFVRDVMIFGFYVGEHFIAAIGVLLAAYFLYKRLWPELSMVVIAWAGEGAIWLFLSQYYHRARPVFDVPVWHQMTSPGFPSGHAMSAVICYGLLAYLLAPKLPARFWKVVLGASAGLIMLYIGVSRLYVGDHYLTDVLAGYALGIAWSGLVYTSIEFIAMKRMNRHVQEA